jgi:hypothetical protein
VNVGPVVAGDLIRPEVQPLHGLIPHRGVVHATLPGMADIHESLAFRVTLPVEIIVPGTQFREGVLEEASRPRLILGMPADM